MANCYYLSNDLHLEYLQRVVMWASSEENDFCYRRRNTEYFPLNTLKLLLFESLLKARISEIITSVEDRMILVVRTTLTDLHV